MNNTPKYWSGATVGKELMGVIVLTSPRSTDRRLSRTVCVRNTSRDMKEAPYNAPS